MVENFNKASTKCFFLFRIRSCLRSALMHGLTILKMYVQCSAKLKNSTAVIKK